LAGLVIGVTGVGPAAAGEVWAPPTHFVTPGLNSFPWPTTGSGFASFGFAVPDDFSTLTSVKVVLLPKTSFNASFDAYGSVKASGEIGSQGLLLSLAVPATLAAGTLQEVDITGLLAAQLEPASAGRDYVSVFFWFPVSPGLEEGTVLGLRFSYDGVRVQSADIEPGAITTNKLEDGAVTNAKLADDSIGTNKIVNNSIGALDINRSEVQARVTGACPAGQSIRAISATGDVLCEPDTAGLKGHSVETNPQACPVSTICNFTASCPAGRRATGGGMELVTAGIAPLVQLSASYPNTSDSWRIRVFNGSPLVADVIVHVVCSGEATGDSSTTLAAASARTPARP